MNSWKRFPRLAYNWTSTVGALIAVFSVITIVFLLIVQMLVPIENRYLGILLYMFLPLALLAGLLLIPLGMYINWRSWQKQGVEPYFKWPMVDLNIRSHRNGALIFITGTLLFILISSVLVYEAYHYTDSVEFCGTTCHTVMKPQYTAYQDSPHARIKCVACHIGPGATWYARSKFRGLYQVYAVIANVYPRPIPTPLEDLRPARDTCEECHWPSQFFGAKQRLFNHFLYDKKNTYWPIDMLIKTGGGNPARMRTRGIHWHASRAIAIEYRARDRERQDIPWVRVTDYYTGRSTVYQDKDNPVSENELTTLGPRFMDCMDCHNRPSHNYHSPDYAIDFELATGRISRNIPEIKKVAIGAMIQEYATEEAAMTGIAGFINDFYRTSYPDFHRNRSKLIERAVTATQAAYNRNIFPYMKVRWSAYENNAGHFIFRGCMRCHDGKHLNEEGVAITNNCNACHIILTQGRSDRSSVDMKEGLEFRHPVDIGDLWKDGSCYSCHSGGGH